MVHVCRYVIVLHIVYTLYNKLITQITQLLLLYTVLQVHQYSRYYQTNTFIFTQQLQLL